MVLYNKMGSYNYQLTFEDFECYPDHVTGPMNFFKCTSNISKTTKLLITDPRQNFGIWMSLVHFGYFEPVSVMFDS